MPKKKSNRKSYPGHLARRHGGWRWQVSVAGERHKMQFHVETRAEAEERAREEYAKLQATARRQMAGAPKPLRMSELFAEFEELDMPPGDSYTDPLKVIKPYFVERLGDPRCDRITGPDIVRFLDWRASHMIGQKVKKRIAPGTVAKTRSVLHVLFEKAVQRGYCPSNPVAATQVPKRRDRFEPVILTDDEFERLISELRNPIAQTYVIVLGEGGFRSESEALHLRWEDVDFEAGFIHVVSGRDGHRTKGGKSRHVPMTLRCQLALREHFAAYRDTLYNGESTRWVFHHRLTRRHHKAGDRVASFYDSLKGAAKRAGIDPRWRPHDLRHRRVTTWLAAGKSATLVKEAVGHADLRTTMGYTHLVKEHLRALVEDAPGTPAQPGRPTLHREA